MVQNLNVLWKIDSCDLKSFEDLFLRLYPVMCRVADRYLHDEVQSKDIAQEAFIKLWAKRNELNTIISVKSYLYTTVRNLSLNYIRDHGKEAALPGCLPDQPEAELKSIVIEEEAIMRIHRAIDHLPAQSSKIIWMTMNGLKNQEIAEQLGISVNSVKTLKYHALRSLKDDLQDLMGIVMLLLSLRS